MTTTTWAGARLGARTTLVGVAGFAVALALASQVALPIPGTPVPITLQPLVVILAGFWLGPVAGASSMVLYLALGAAGLPMFSPFGAPGIARFVGPTGGYLFAYPVSAFIAGWFGRRVSTFTGRAFVAVSASAVLLAGGLLQLAVLNGSLSRALELGLHPFVPLDAVKAVVAALLAPRSRRSNRAPA